MFSFLVNHLRNNSGKASKPNLAVVLLFFIVLIQAFFLFKAYGPKTKHPIRPKTAKSATKIPAPAPNKVIPSLPTQQPTPLPKIGKIALIIDDSGYSLKDCDRLAAITVPVTISILPQLPHSNDVAQCAHAQGKEVMLHLPLEPHVFREEYPANYFIKTTMSSSQIIKRLNESIASVPYLSGINNHEGSKATEDSRVMYIIFKEILKRNLFFVDSRVTSQSVCKALAEKLEISFTGRDIFLDNSSQRLEIEKQFNALSQKAKLNGTAVAIGHARKTSWVVMTEQIKKLSNEGFEFVTVKEMIRSQGGQ